MPRNNNNKFGSQQRHNERSNVANAKMTMRESAAECGRKRKIENERKKKKIKCSGLRHTHHSTMHADGVMTVLNDCVMYVLLLYLRFIGGTNRMKCKRKKSIFRRF